MEEGLKKEEDVFLDGVNNCRVTMWASLTRTENKKQKSVEGVEYVAGSRVFFRNRNHFHMADSEEPEQDCD